MSSDDPVTVREFDMLRQQVAGLAGVPGLAVQVAEVIKDVSTLTADLATHREDHHRAEEARQIREQAAESARRNRVRWAWGFAVSALAVLEATLGLVLAHIG